MLQSTSLRNIMLRVLHISIIICTILLSAGTDPSQAAIYATGRTIISYKPFIAQLYRDVLARPVDQSNLTLWIDYLHRGGTRDQVAQALITSMEYRQNLITRFFRQYLGRNPAPADLTIWLTAIGNGSTDEAVLAALLSSAEYYTRNGSTNIRFIEALYKDLLGRSPSSAELAGHNAVLNSNTAAHMQVATTILAGSEYRQQLINGYYQYYLKRTPLAVDLNFWLNAMNTGYNDEQVIVALLASPEYLHRNLSGIQPGASFTSIVASFTDSATGRLPLAVGDYIATISWGDGESSPGTILATSSGYNIIGTHTYNRSGTFTVGVSINSMLNSDANIANSTLTVQYPVLIPFALRASSSSW